jgi:hypothetical protein
MTFLATDVEVTYETVVVVGSFLFRFNVCSCLNQSLEARANATTPETVASRNLPDLISTLLPIVMASADIRLSV